MIALRNFSAGADKQAFHRYLTNFEAVDSEVLLLDALRDCPELRPSRYAEMLSLPLGSTYRDAVALLLASWTSSLRTPDPHALDE